MKNALDADLSKKPGKDELQDVIDKTLEDLAEAATSEEAEEKVKSLLDTLSQVGFSRYSWSNKLLIIAQVRSRDGMDLSDTSHFNGYHTWHDDYNRQVIGGSTGFKILAPRTGLLCPTCGCTPDYHPKKPELDCPRAGTDPKTWDFDPEEEWRYGVYRFKRTTTFAYSQTEPCEEADGEAWKPDELTAMGDATGLWASFNRLADEWGVAVETTDLLGSRRGSSDGEGNIRIEATDPTAQQVSTLIHELAHERLHGEADRQDGATERIEVEAEATAYVVGRYFGLDMSDRELYVARWNDDPDGLRGRLNKVSELAKEIIKRIESFDGEGERQT